jgi:NADPH:quinone reductase-like Zn-dependent oxidoreductase
VQLTQRARRAIGQELDMVADLVGQGTLAASLLVMREGGRAGSFVELAGDLGRVSKVGVSREMLPVWDEGI